MRYARIVAAAVADIRIFGVAPDPNPNKGLVWLPCDAGIAPSFDPSTEVLNAPTYDIGEGYVTESITKRNKTAQELSDALNFRVSTLNVGDLVTVLTAIVNEERTNRTVPVSPISEATFKAFAKARLS